MSASSHPPALAGKRGAPEPPAAVAVPMEDALQALIDHLVAPLLPMRAFLQTSPSQEEQQFVAREMHSVVLLYNYYHRKQFPHLVYLDFRSFCKQATICKPSLFSFMKFMQKNVEYSLDLDKELSIMEKEIMNACNIATTLDALKNSTNMNGWPVSNVAVLLVDADQEKCYLDEFGSITTEIWSLPEKRLDKPFASEIKSFSSYYSNKSLKNSLQQLAISAVQQKTGNCCLKICVLEDHLVYSLNDEKTTTMLFIMKSLDTVNGALVEFSIKDVLSRLRGPLINAGLTPELTSVVEYYRLLPYVDILSDWLSRVALQCPYSNSSPTTISDHCKIRNNSSSDQLQQSSSREEDAGSRKSVTAKHGSDIYCSLDGSNGCTDKKRRTEEGNAIAIDSYHQPLVLVAENLASENIDEPDPAVPSNKHEVVHASLRILQKGLDDLVREHRHSGDELARYEMKIQAILSGKLDVESVTASCSSQTHTCTTSPPQEIKVRRLSEAILRSKSPHQELDDICCQNGWIMPRYSVFPSIANERFQASVSIRGIDFEASVVGDFRSNPSEARSSAATIMISKLHSMSDPQALT